MRTVIKIRFLSLILFLANVTSYAQQRGVTFARQFAPQEGLIKAVEMPYRDEICLNGSWQFQPIALPANYDLKNGVPLLPAATKDGWSSTPIKIPSPWNVNAFGYNGGKTYPSYPAAWEKARMGWLKRNFTVPQHFKGKRLILHFEAIAGSAQVYVNGKQVAEHFDNALPFETDITDFVNEDDTPNELLVGVRQENLFDVPGMFGSNTYPSGSPWTRQMTGIWQDVFLQALPDVRVQNIYLKPLVDKGVLEMELTIVNSTGLPQNFTVSGNILPWINKADTSSVLTAPEPNWELGKAVTAIPVTKARVGPRTTTTITITKPIGNELKYWAPETPNLYAVVLDVKQNDTTSDRFYQRFGWRQWGISGTQVTLNGKPYQLRGESGHLLGVAYLSRRYAWSWYKAIKDVNGNAIRLHANIRPRFYMDMADEMGMAILEESEIYASTMQINYYAPETWQRFRDHIDNMVLRDRNYPCIFGWSIANEVLSALWWNGTPRKFWQPVIDNTAALADRIKILDPTRPWISSDGDGDFHGKLPTYIYHYGSPQDWQRNAPKNKPFGIGEGGSMLWGSPPVFAAYNGERSYESLEGLREGIAIETYWYLAEQRKISAFTSIFTILGTCFETIPLGVADAKNTSPNDGIYFSDYTEGVPGVQPEKLPAYSLNLNPGYDASQPFYKPTPAFEAVKAAYNPAGPLPSKYDHRVTTATLPSPPKASLKQVSFWGNEQGSLHQALESAGIASTKKNGSAVLVVDGAALNSGNIEEARQTLSSALKNKGTVFIWADSNKINELNAILPATISVQPQQADVLYADRTATETASIALADLYFRDEANKTIVYHTLAGAMADESKKLLVTNLFSRRWTMDDEENKQPVMIAKDTMGGKIIITTLLPDLRSAKRLQLFRSLFANLGLTLSAPNDLYNNGFDGAGFLNQALLLGAFQGSNYPKILDNNFIGDEAKQDPAAGDKAGNRVWTKASASGDGLFDFFRIGIPGTEGSRARFSGGILTNESLDANAYMEVVERVSGTNPGTNSVVYASFWVHTPKAFNNGALTMSLRSDDGVKLYINSNKVFEDKTIYGSGMTEPKKIPVAFNEGWNHVFIKIGQLDGPWLFSVQFETVDKEALGKLHAAAVKPQ